MGLQRPCDAGARQHHRLAFPNQRQRRPDAGGAAGDRRRAVDRRQPGRRPARPARVGLALGSINGAFNLDVALSALERTGKGRILSTPRVSTQNNVEAEITQGVQIPIQTVANNTVTVTFKDAALTLKVTPQITAANTVIMRIALENASPDFSRVGQRHPADQHAARDRRRCWSDDGDTTVIGGIYISQRADDQRPDAGSAPPAAARLAVQARRRSATRAASC